MKGLTLGFSGQREAGEEGADGDIRDGTCSHSHCSSWQQTKTKDGKLVLTRGCRFNFREEIMQQHSKVVDPYHDQYYYYFMYSSSGSMI